MITGPDTDAYSVLGVDADASDRQIAAAYRALARRHHPDVAGEAMTQINAAFELVRDDERRMAYERRLLADGHVSAGRRMAERRRAVDAAAAARGGRAAWSVSWVPERDGSGGAGVPPGRPSGSVLRFGRHLGWSIGEIARRDPGYLEWLETRPEGRPYVSEIDETLKRMGAHRGPSYSTGATRGFRR